MSLEGKWVRMRPRPMVYFIPEAHITGRVIRLVPGTEKQEFWPAEFEWEVDVYGEVQIYHAWELEIISLLDVIAAGVAEPAAD